MPVGNHSIKTNKGLYISNVSESETSKVENAPERISKLISKMNLSGYKGNKLSNVILPDGFVWENEDTILKTTGKYKANFSVDGKYYPILLYVVVTEKNTNDDEESYIPLNPTYTYKEIIGSDRYDTAGLIADKLESYNTAILVNAESSISDGLSAAGLAGKENASILLVKKDNVPQSTLNRLKKVKKVYIICGENAISQKVVGQINKINPNIEKKRLGGKTRVETSEIVAKEIGNYSNAFMVNGFRGEADAMSVSTVEAKLESPIILTNGKNSEYDKKFGVKYYVIGGNSVMNDSIVEKYDAKRISGENRYETNRNVIKEFYPNSKKLYIANGETLVDALTASTLAKNDGIVLVNKNSDNSILEGKDTVQVGGMKFEIDFGKDK